MKTVVIFLLCATVTLRALAAPAEKAPVQEVEVKEEPKPQAEAEEELPALVPEVQSQLCFPGWEYYRGSCYYLNNNYLTWKDAVSFCANFEATLASVHGLLENNQLQHMAGSASHVSAWTGGFYFEGQWRWQDGSVFGYDKFEDLGSVLNYQCVLLETQANKGWFNSECSRIAPSICKIKVSC